MSSSSSPDTSSSSSSADMQQPSSILHLSFNQDADCFAIGTTDGFIVYDTDPLRKSIHRNFSGGGIRIVQMLFRGNILALVGAVGPSRNKVMIWDDHLNRYIDELIFRSEVKAVRLRRDRIVVVLLQKIYVYDFSHLKLIHQIETQENPLGLCEISQSKESMVLVCSGLRSGYVWVENYTMKKRKHVMAHNSSVALVALMNDGRLMATASSKGTLIRVFSTMDGSLLHEFRRGSERATICSLCFSSDAQWLAVSSDKGTVHVFNLKVESRCSQNAETNKHAPLSVSRLSFVKGVLPKYFSSKWSVAQFYVQEGLQHIVSFEQRENTVAIIGCDGRYYRCEFDPVHGGEMTQLECHNL